MKWGAIGYSMNGDEWIFELTPASEYNKLVTKVNGAQIGDMPEFTSTMKLGLTGLLKSDAASRHMIIISDGDPPMPPPEILKGVPGFSNDGFHHRCVSARPARRSGVECHLQCNRWPLLLSVRSPTAALDLY